MVLGEVGGLGEDAQPSDDIFQIAGIGSGIDQLPAEAKEPECFLDNGLNQRGRHMLDELAGHNRVNAFVIKGNFGRRGADLFIVGIGRNGGDALRNQVDRDQSGFWKSLAKHCGTPASIASDINNRFGWAFDASAHLLVSFECEIIDFTLSLSAIDLHQGIEILHYSDLRERGQP